jgi:hypothetical protein
LTFFCDADGVRVRMPQEWTDRGPEPAAEPVSAETLTVLRDLLDTIGCRKSNSGRDDKPLDQDVEVTSVDGGGRR